MSTPIDINTILSNVVADRARFQPTDEMRAVKSQFWTRVASGDTQVPDDLDLATALRLGASEAISRWWDQSGFVEWFSNRDEFRERLDYISQLALDHLQDIISDRAANASARVAAIKLTMELASRIPKKNEGQEVYLDEKVAEMDRTELEDYIRKHMSLVSDK